MAKLNEIPTVGDNSYYLPSYISGLRNLRRVSAIIKEGYEKYPGRAFKIPLPDRWLVVISGPDMLEDIRKATDEQLSLRAAFQDFLHTELFFGRQTRVDPYHVFIFKNTLTRSIGPKFSDMYEEMVAAFEGIPMTRDWTKIPVLKKVLPIVCRTSNRVFVGAPLCRSEDWLALNIEYTTKVFSRAMMLNLLPKLLQPVVGRLISPLPACVRRAEKHLVPVILERLEAEDKTYGDCPDDLLTWLIQGAQGVQERLKPGNLVRRMLNANFAAVHTTSNVRSRVTYTESLMLNIDTSYLQRPSLEHSFISWSTQNT
ncbi:hypothetical protein E1B28_001684 [Marasmius oreades]|uniref:Cytochrome P450 n=1 Tax=Marasmius oreades TaxID=181124 RepID=A0A9P8AFS9_9AGAR|nr:uncharacterized protein E1B28_001684 [Marasmius oreades]KAG7099883.1 hypothetical protein E1B28_001684 [Marasmius oreades]